MQPLKFPLKVHFHSVHNYVQTLYLQFGNHLQKNLILET